MVRPNILFIVLDTQRADRLSCYGCPRPTTPQIDRFAESATLFERAISPAQWTIPAHASMFTGEYPSTHQTVQADLELGSAFPTLAELLRLNGYATVGFCNNPLVGILKNGLRRGFEAFYNYGGALPTRPADGTPLPHHLAWLVEQYTQFWRRLSYPVQNAFAKSDFLFQLALQPWLVPIWTRLSNFKGDTAASLRDVSRFLHKAAQANERPFFCFVNLMEPHLPYWPPEPFVQRFVPYFGQSRAARDFLRCYNHQPYRWMAPLPEALDPLQAQVLSDIYDAEVAYQDHLLGQVFATLSASGLEQNTLVVVVADHGEGLGEHQFVGHAFVVFEELVRVPLIVRYPGRFPAGERISMPVSTRRLFHTLLEVAGVGPSLARQSKRTLRGRQTQQDIARLSLSRSLGGSDPEQEIVLSEAFPPHILTRAMEQRAEQGLLQQFACHDTRRALYQGASKLIQVGSERHLYDLTHDPLEVDPGQDTMRMQELGRLLEDQVHQAEARRPDHMAPQRLNLDSDADLVRRMQELGYLE